MVLVGVVAAPVCTELWGVLVPLEHSLAYLVQYPKPYTQSLTPKP